ncbi:MAG: Lysine exporter protein [Pedosphaera sp.]|nr:Lysine exporter protein [Pedosphaera sp.]
MLELPPILVAALTGFFFGLLLSIPVGPVNLTIMNEGARGFKWGALIGLGASLMEVIYCAIAFTGFAAFFEQDYVKAAMELLSFAFMLFLGMKFILMKSIPSASPIEAKIEKKLHPHSAFMTGFVRTMANPGVLIFWIFLAAIFISHKWVEPTWSGKGACILGVAFGTSLWFLGLSWAASHGHKKFSDQTLLRIQKGSGIGLLALALAHGVQIVWEMVQHHNKL